MVSSFFRISSFRAIISSKMISVVGILIFFPIAALIVLDLFDDGEDFEVEVLVSGSLAFFIKLPLVKSFLEGGIPDMDVLL